MNFVPWDSFQTEVDETQSQSNQVILTLMDGGSKILYLFQILQKIPENQKKVFSHFFLVIYKVRGQCASLGTQAASGSPLPLGLNLKPNFNQYRIPQILWPTFFRPNTPPSRCFAS